MYLNYKQYLPVIHFQELVRASEDTVSVREFFPREYLTWLDTATNAQKPPATGNVVLQVSKEFKIFGRSLCIYRDKFYTTPTDLIIRRGEAVYLKAASGVGKTTLAKIIMGLYQADKFNMILDGIECNEKTKTSVWARQIWGKAAGMVFQHADEALNLQATVNDTFQGLPIKEKFKEEELKSFLSELFEEEITSPFLNKKVAFLSGGQKQRLNLLRTFALNPVLIILDEPLNGLDFLSIKKVYTLLGRKLKQGSAILLISHNEEIMDAIVSGDNVYYLQEA
jgi:ABC-type glutathione transport system ATPase component